MSKFEEMAMAVASKGELSSDDKLAELKAQRDQVLKAFDFKIGEVESEKNVYKLQKEKMKIREKEQRLETDMIKSFLDKESAGVYSGQTPAPQSFNPNPFPMGQGALQNDQSME